MISDWTSFLLRRPKKAPSLPPEGIPVGTTPAGSIVSWPERSRQSSASFLAVAGSGSGKSVLLAHILSEEIVRDLVRPLDVRGSLFVCDIKGDLCEMILAALAAKAPETLARVSYLQPFKGGFPLNLNLLERGRTPLELMAFMLAQMIGSSSTSAGQLKDGGVGARQIDVLQHVLLGALAVPDGHPLLAIDALVTKDGFSKLAAATESPRARSFLLGPRPNDDLLISTASRLRMALAASAALEQIVTAPAALQWSDILSPGGIVLLDLSDPLGGAASQAAYANIILRLALEWANSKSSAVVGEANHVRFVCDEAQVVAPALADGTAEYTLSTGRSRGGGVSLGIITQSSALLRKQSESLWEIILANAPTKIVGRLSPIDAELMAKGDAPGPGSTENPGAHRARLAATIASLRDREFMIMRPGERQKIRSTEVDVKGWFQVAAREAATIREVKNRLALPERAGPRSTLADFAKARAPGARPIDEDNSTRVAAKGRSRWG